MIKIIEMIDRAKQFGYDETNAEAKVCQDIILTLISHSQYNRNVTVKGGVVMRSITNNTRRATQDMDLDFIKYSLEDDSIDRFVNKLNSVGLVSIKRVGNIEELKQQDYHGKRIYVEITDNDNYTLKSKVDLGVHKHYDIAQEEFCFDVGMDDEGASLLINSKEQMLTEKLRSILKFGQFSTRYKDVFDIYYLTDIIDQAKLKSCFKIFIYNDEGMRENNIDDIINRVERTFSDRSYISKLKTSKKNWLDTDIDTVLSGIVAFLKAQI
ncbi:MAG: nucleotidyl transferase AbiEii/AbiGii toxin family protein [Clostridia bacterium]|nr:nucleotidyl transferase AbiEii/AbiGii toxin family protein [Clostridia bacterium]